MVISAAKNPESYLEELPEEKREVIRKFREMILRNIPDGFEECMGYGMIAYVVPHSLYPNGYHCDQTKPLPFISLAAQKHHYALYHMGLYTGSGLIEWLEKELRKAGIKPDMGKCCIRFKKPNSIPWEILAELVTKLTPQEWIDIYEKSINSERKSRPVSQKKS